MRVFAILVILLGLAVGAFFLFFNDPEKSVPSDATTSTTQKPASGGPASTKRAESTLAPEEKAAEQSNNQKPSVKETEAKPSKPIVIEKPKVLEKQETKTGIAAMANPSFDVVRVDENCGLLVAGRAEPTSVVSIFANETKLGEAVTSSRGEWVFLADKPLASGAQQINATAINPDGKKVETPRMVIMQVPDCTKVIEKRDPAIAVLAPKPEDGKETDISERVSKLLQLPEPKGDVSKAEDLAVGSIDYDEKGNVALSGQGKPGNQVDVYLDNKHIGSSQVDENGDWKLSPENDVPTGKYNLRVDQSNKDDKVISRVELPFKREAAEDVILAKGGLEIRAVVQPGNSLWRIARRMYGDGLQYTLIYQANESQIRDPDLIYPGQIFRIPESQ
ncbi:LysM peptidoglycan-binding domain-containing protein [Sneathiella sp. P13V-1]|uniref:LysM peptidoglycan-binding domain-containing protein n=1 Tax=Sneathiella sp. P13V-1 TaxID=2697366 RepID=UPI00187B19CC|nr:LysM peptidoglycan-binding domain-containing protein [Sneathiella sp. P13V-1]MBE7637432.1 LysM peptidoglycan-binding domain-containing protein [Sneathiella sp. P13V-1]